MIETQRGRGYVANDLIEVYCSMCNRIFSQFSVPKGGVFRFEFSTPQVPCHAGSITIQTPPEDPFERVRKLLEGAAVGKENFSFVLHVYDGMLVSVEVARD